MEERQQKYANMLCGSLEGGVEKQEPVINSDTQLKSDSDVKFQNQATNLFVVAYVNMQPDVQFV